MENTCRIPRKITAGDSVSWVESWGEYPVVLYTLKLTLIDAALTQTFTAEAQGNDHLFAINAAASAGFTAGMIDYQLVATATDFRKTIDRGRIEVLPDLTVLQTYDGRDWIDKAIAALEASIAGRASKTQLKQDIDGVSIEHMSQIDQMTMLDKLYAKRNVREMKKRLAGGRSPFTTIASRFPS